MDAGDGDASPESVARRVARTLRCNWTTVLRDVVVVVAWPVLLAAALAQVGPTRVPLVDLSPTWLYYLLLVVGLAAYSLVSGPWRLPE